VQEVNRTWGALGLATGLTLKPAAMFSQPELNGKFRQRPIRLYTYNAGTQSHRTTYICSFATISVDSTAKRGMILNSGITYVETNIIRDISAIASEGFSHSVVCEEKHEVPLGAIIPVAVA
jgi:hypothetical protein